MFDEGKKKGISDKVSGYLFDKEKPQNGDKEESKYLDMRTDIPNKETHNAVVYYRILEECYECKAAGKLANILERLLISKDRMGRLEAVNVLKQEMPKKETLIRGVAESLKELEES